jgi:hydrogenase nickel incorporation protein HypA/HybF
LVLSGRHDTSLPPPPAILAIIGRRPLQLPFMHELGIAQEIVEIACAQARGTRITRIVVQIGKLSAVLPDAVRFCFDLCTEGTLAAGATLEIVEPAGLARCRQCGGSVLLERPFGQCACGCSDLEWLSGDELRIQAVEIT